MVLPSYGHKSLPILVDSDEHGHTIKFPDFIGPNFSNIDSRSIHTDSDIMRLSETLQLKIIKNL